MIFFPNHRKDSVVCAVAKCDVLLILTELCEDCCAQIFRDHGPLNHADPLGTTQGDENEQTLLAGFIEVLHSINDDVLCCCTLDY